MPGDFINRYFPKFSMDVESRKIEENIQEVEEQIEASESGEPAQGTDDTEQKLLESGTEIHGEIEELKQRIEKLEIESQNNHIHEKALKNRLEEIEADIENLEEGLGGSDKRMREELGTVTERIDQLEEKIVSKGDVGNERIDQLESELKKIRNRFEEGSSEKETGEAVISEEESEAFEQIRRNSDKIDSLREKFQDYQAAETSESADGNSDLAEQVRDNSESIEELYSHVEELSEAVRNALN